MVFEEKKMEVFDKISLVGPIFFLFPESTGSCNMATQSCEPILRC